MKKEFIEQYNPINEIQSAHTELLKAHEYADDVLYPLEALKEKGRYWLGELQNPLRSSRNLVEVNHLVDLLLFEVATRTGEIKSLEDYHTSIQKQ